MHLNRLLSKGQEVLKNEVVRLKENLLFGKYSADLDNWICDLTVSDESGQIKKLIKRNRC